MVLCLHCQLNIIYHCYVKFFFFLFSPNIEIIIVAGHNIEFIFLFLPNIIHFKNIAELIRSVHMCCPTCQASNCNISLQFPFCFQWLPPGMNKWGLGSISNVLLASLLCYAQGAIVPPPWADPNHNPCASQPGGWQLIYWPADKKCYRIFQRGWVPLDLLIERDVKLQ